jgi:hypothetical protein
MADQGYVVACPGAPPSNYPFVIGSEKTVVSGWNYVDLDNPEIVAEKSHAFEKGYQTIKIHRRFSKWSAGRPRKTIDEPPRGFCAVAILNDEGQNEVNHPLKISGIPARLQ